MRPAAIMPPTSFGAAVIEGSDPPRLVYALLDRSAFVIVDDRDTIGMRGTGSRRVAADGVFVPNLRTITAPGTSDEVPPGWGTHESPPYRGGFYNLLFFEIGRCHCHRTRRITWAVRLAWSIWRRLGCSKPLIVKYAGNVCPALRKVLDFGATRSHADSTHTSWREFGHGTEQRFNHADGG